MSIVDKTLFMNRIKIRLESEVTCADRDKVLKALTMELNNFDMTQTGFTQGNLDYLGAYLDSLAVSGRSPKTIQLYKYEIGKLMKFVNVSTNEVTVYHIRDFLANEKKRGLADNTLKGYRDVYLAYFRWLFREGMISVDPTVNLIPIKVAKKVKVVFTELDIENLKNAADNMRDKAIISFLYSTGCRIGEVYSLDRDSIDLHERECIVHGKGNKERTAYFDTITAHYLKEYLKTRKDFESALFVAEKTKKRLKPGGYRAMLNKVAVKANVEHVHPHKFRSSFATSKADHGMPIHQLSRLMGHDKVDTTMRYVSQSNSKLKADYQRYA